MLFFSCLDRLMKEKLYLYTLLTLLLQKNLQQKYLEFLQVQNFLRLILVEKLFVYERDSKLFLLLCFRVCLCIFLKFFHVKQKFVLRLFQVYMDQIVFYFRSFFLSKVLHCQEIFLLKTVVIFHQLCV